MDCLYNSDGKVSSILSTLTETTNAQYLATCITKLNEILTTFDDHDSSLEELKGRVGVDEQQQSESLFHKVIEAQTLIKDVATYLTYIKQKTDLIPTGIGPSLTSIIDKIDNLEAGQKAIIEHNAKLTLAQEYATVKTILFVVHYICNAVGQNTGVIKSDGTLIKQYSRRSCVS